LGSLSKIKRQIPESIVNTPLPPLPVDKRAMVVENGNHRVSSGGTYDYLSEHRTLENDDIYTKPMVSNSNCTLSLPPPQILINPHY
jgi:hypothetical protein